MSKIISLHIPKTAGTTFKTLMMQKFINSTKIIDLKPVVKRCDGVLTNSPINFSTYREKYIHGHFTFKDFIYNEEFTYITWLRNPIERVVSHYYYFKVKPITAYTHPVEHKIKYENLSLEEFIQIPCMQNIQSYYIDSVENYDKLDFIGITDNFNQSILALKETTGIDLTSYALKQINQNRQKEKVSACIRKLIEKYNLKDCELYEKRLQDVKKRENGT